MPGYYVDDRSDPALNNPNLLERSRNMWPTANIGNGHFNAIAFAIDAYAHNGWNWDRWYVNPGHYVNWPDNSANSRRYYFQFKRCRQPLPAFTLIRCIRETSTQVPEIFVPNPPSDD